MAAYSFNKMKFPQFTSLPREIQLQIWEAVVAGPSMHIFDVCFPTAQGPPRSEKAFGPLEDMDEKTRERYDKYEKTAFLDSLDTSSEEINRFTRIARYTFDPSIYRLTSSLAIVSKSTSAIAQRAMRSVPTHTVYLPGRDRTLSYAESDVLMLRFRDIGATTQAASQMFPTLEASIFQVSTVSEVLQSQWSVEMAETLQNATKIALDVSEAWVPGIAGDMAFEEIRYLACTLQHDLEVLYLVDNCVGRCKGCKRDHINAQDLRTRGELFNGLHYQDGGDTDRPGDVIQAISKRYVEVFDLEKMGWEDEHPTYMFARMIDEAIRTQQQGGDRMRFRGVRVLIVEDEELEGRDARLLVDCTAETVPEFSMEMMEELSMVLFPALAGIGLTG